MRYLASVNIELIEASEFISINLYDKNGHLADQVIKPYIDVETSVKELQALARTYDQAYFEAWTSSTELFAAFLQTPGIGGQLKHRDDTADTLSALKQHEDIIRELYDVKLKPVLPKWKQWLINKLTKLKERLENE
jgi:hypothetical protein